MRILSIFGTRPEAIKMAPVINVLEETKGIDSRVCVTAQHREMLDSVLKVFKVRTDHDLNIMQPNQKKTHYLNLLHLEKHTINYKTVVYQK